MHSTGVDIYISTRPDAAPAIKYWWL